MSGHVSAADPAGRARDAAAADPLLIGLRLWLPIGAFFAIGAVLLVRCGFWIEPAAVARRGVQLLAGCAAAIGLLAMPASRRVGFVFNATLQSLVVVMAGMMCTYAAATSGRPLVDGALLWIDRGMGYDWRSYAELIAACPPVSRVAAIAYDMIYLLPLVLIAALGFTGRYERVELFILVFALSLALTIMIFADFPATTAYAYLGVPRAEVIRLHLPYIDKGWIKDLVDIRAGLGRRLTPDSGSGLIAFPSYHCIAALQSAWAVWPLRRLRVPFVVLGGAMIAATPIFGGHYLIDLVGGAGVTLVSIAAGIRLQRLLGRVIPRVPVVTRGVPPQAALG